MKTKLYIAESELHVGDKHVIYYLLNSTQMRLHNVFLLAGLINQPNKYS